MTLTQLQSLPADKLVSLTSISRALHLGIGLLMRCAEKGSLTIVEYKDVGRRFVTAGEALRFYNQSQIGTVKPKTEQVQESVKESATVSVPN